MECGCPHHVAGSSSEVKVCPVKVYLSNLAVWTAKLHNLHWNVVGINFFSLHEYTEKLYDETFEQYDSVAEAMKMRDGMPPVRLSEYLELATIKELDAKEFRPEEVLQELFNDMTLMANLAREIRAGADQKGDDQLVALFDGFIGYYDKQLWFLRATMK